MKLFYVRSSDTALQLATKGQVISEAIFLGFNSSKKRTKYFQKFALATRAEVFVRFLEELKKQKNASEII